MEMGAFVIVANGPPACVCTPPRGANAAQSSAGVVGSYVTMAAAAAAAQAQYQQQQMQIQQQQQQQQMVTIPH
jgi:hypothetical protein